ncbi:MAG: DUF732 domain-containing protein [Mycobacterium sp.]|uniref:DUF732 domain-containing protein n=1 Tax=Mycobacterium sp. TaxID=1785 RepID=UPI003C7353A5
MKRLMMLVGVATMTIVAAPAYADPPTPPNNDADFVQQLHAAGLTYQDPAKAVTVAKDVCDLADKGTPQAEIEKNLQSQNPSFSGNGVRNFVMLAAAEYCPKYLPAKYLPTETSAANAPSEASPPKPPGA